MKGPLRLLNSLFSCPLDAYLECEMKLPSPTRMTSFFVRIFNLFFFLPLLVSLQKVAPQMVFGHRDHRQQSYDTKNDTYFFSFSYFLQPTTIQCSPWVTYLVKTGHKKAITLACYRKILDKGIMPQCVLTRAARRRQVGYLCIHWAPIQKSAQVF